MADRTELLAKAKALLTRPDEPTPREILAIVVEALEQRVEEDGDIAAAFENVWT